MRKTIVSILAILFIFSLETFAQGKIEFEKTSHNFGTIKEEKGAADVSFSFKNTGKEPITLTSVKASCGCTTPEWSKDAIQPGETGFVKASYNTRNRPGAFNKSVTVRTDGDPQVVVLRISGEVTPRPKGITDFYPSEVGNLRFKTTHIAFGKVLHNSYDTASTIIYNQGDTPITINLKDTKLPKHLTASIDKTVIEPKQTAIMSFKFDATIKNEWGYNFENIQLQTNDTESADKRINISANIKEDFSAAEEGGKSPKITFDKTSHQFGDIQQQSRVSTTFKLTNEGDAPLYIRKTKASCGCTASKPQKTELQPGESTSIDVTFSSGSRKGKQKKSITVICNDPSKDVTTLWIESNVLEGSTEKE